MIPYLQFERRANLSVSAGLKLAATARFEIRDISTEYIQLPAKLLNYFLRSNKSNINQLLSPGRYPGRHLFSRSPPSTIESCSTVSSPPRSMWKATWHHQIHLWGGWKRDEWWVNYVEVMKMWVNLFHFGWSWLTFSLNSFLKSVAFNNLFFPFYRLADFTYL